MSFGRLGSLGRGFGRMGSSSGGGSVIPGVIAAGGGSYAWTGQDATLTITAQRSVAADAGSYAWSGDTMTPLQNHFVTASGGSYAWTGQDATLTASGAASYTGPGDIVSGAYVWYGLRAYNAAYATGSNPALDIVDQAGANQLTVNILSDGRLDVASISAWVSANSVSTIKVKRWYDQIGSRHLDQATLTNMPALDLTGFGSLPAIVTNGTVPQGMIAAGGNLVKAQPITYSLVYIYDGREGEAVAHFGTFINTRSGDLKVRAGNNPSAVTAANGSWHAIQGIVNTTSSALYVDGAGTTGISAGSNAPNSGITLNVNIDFQAPSNKYAEFGIWDIAFNGTQAGDMNTNQHGTSGYNF